MTRKVGEWWAARPKTWTLLYTGLSVVVVAGVAAGGWAAVSFGASSPKEAGTSTSGRLLSAVAQSAAYPLEEQAPLPESFEAAAVEPGVVKPAGKAGIAVSPVSSSPAPRRSAAAALAEGPMVGKFTLKCGPDNIFSNVPNGMCVVQSAGGFSGEVRFSCLKLPPGLTCLFNPPSVNVAVGGSASTKFAFDSNAWNATGYGWHDYRVEASRGDFSVTNFVSANRVDPNNDSEPSTGRVFTADDFADEPHIEFACDPPPGEPMPLVQGQSIKITCKVGSYLGFSAPVEVGCLGPLSCAGTGTVTPPPNGSVTIVITVTVPVGLQQPLHNDSILSIYAFRDTVYVNPGMLNYYPTIPRLTYFP
jgi:hypothetical protein